MPSPVSIVQIDTRRLKLLCRQVLLVQLQSGRRERFLVLSTLSFSQDPCFFYFIYFALTFFFFFLFRFKLFFFYFLEVSCLFETFFFHVVIYHCKVSSQCCFCCILYVLVRFISLSTVLRFFKTFPLISSLAHWCSEVCCLISTYFCNFQFSSCCYWMEC